MTEKKAKWPNNDSEYARDWDFDKFQRWALTHILDGFITGGSKSAAANLYTVLIVHAQWNDNRLAQAKKDQS